MTIAKLGRYWHTLRRLKPVQFYGRVWFRLYRPRVNAPTTAEPLRFPKGNWQKPAARAASMLGPWQFRFLNQIHTLPAQCGWNYAGLEKLWIYNLHYFDDLNACEAGGRVEWHQALIERWLLENAPTTGNGWEPYPTSLRIVNWVKWLAAGNAAVPGMLESMALQAGWLARRLEWHLLGNHLFANAKALVFAGLLCEGPQAAAWLATGLKIITRELPEQVLADGGNFERSPMYHSIFLEDVLDLVNAVGQWPGLVPVAQVAGWRETARRMLDWLAGMTHPDGQIAFFNDAAFGIAPEPAALRAYAQRLGIQNGSPRRFSPRDDELARERCTHFADSGYVRLEQGNAVALLDVARVGPDYLPGHAHADTLSFELSLFGQRVVVNGGTSRYGLGPERLRERQTVSHSTVEVAGESSSEVWGGFRVARRARPFDLRLATHEGTTTVACSHDGYRRLPGAPVHRREWAWRNGSMAVTDAVMGGQHAAVARYYLHPAVRVTGEGRMGQLQLTDGRVVRWSVTGGAARVVAATWHPEFGLSIPCQRIEVLFDGPEVRFEFAWD